LRMKVRLTLICLFFLSEYIILSLQDGETLRTYTENEGGSITVRCEFGYSGVKRFLCKKTCEGKNILIVTTEETDQRGRFSIRYEKRNIFSSDFLYVSITDLKPSDSGRYRCCSDETLDGTLYDDFYLVVTKISALKTKLQILDKILCFCRVGPLIRSTFSSSASTTTATTTSRRTTAAATAAATATAATQSQSFSLSPSESVKLSEKPVAASGSPSVHVDEMIWVC
uniref:Immunoglobulin V-set domain-containing protein n=1 Tax=Xiphophorus couchianus TaxID=32473 RepID=A0A3B5MB91_9TELE